MYNLWKMYFQRLNFWVKYPYYVLQQHFHYTFSSSELRGRVSELERNLSTQEKDIRNQASKLQELQTQLTQARKELTERDRDVAKTSHELSQATDRHQQDVTKVGSYDWRMVTLLIWDILFLFNIC